MISLTVARKYAKALLEIGRREKSSEALGKDLDRLAELFQAHKELRGVLFSPFYPAPQRKAISQRIGESLGLSPAILDFLKLLIERNRMDHFPAIVKSYRELLDEDFQRLRATLLFPLTVPSTLMAEIQKELESATGKQVILTTQEDPSLIGGVVTKIGNVIYDGSLRTQLLKAKENLYKE